MDKSEALVAAFLAHNGHTSVVYEPDGNMPPDFLLDGRVAIEVRRLNQNHSGPMGTQGLEEVSIPLERCVRELLLSLGPPTTGVSWFVHYSFSRPVERWKTLKRKFRAVLETFMKSPNQIEARWRLGDGFEVSVARSSLTRPTFYILGAPDDDEAGGWLISEMERNLRICIEEKTSKIGRARSKYPEWWLILVDQIGYGLDAGDRSQLREIISVAPEWRKIGLLNPLDHTQVFAIQGPSF